MALHHMSCSLIHTVFCSFFFLMIRRPPRSTLFPYTTPSDLHAQEQRNAAQNVYRSVEHDQKTGLTTDRKSGSAGMPRPISYAVFCLKKKTAAAAWVAGEQARQPQAVACDVRRPGVTDAGRFV